MSTITLKILAKELNLSTAAISKALRDSHEISIHTKQRVQALANQLNYVPNPYAGSLRKRKSKTIAVVLPEIADSFFALAINGIESVALEQGYHVLIYLTHEKINREKAILKDLQSGRVDGVLMSITAETESFEHIQELTSNNIPLVFFDRICENINTAKITTNDYEIAYEATRHLIDSGCKSITLLSISKSLSISSKRMEGYRKALKDNNMQRSENILLCNEDQSGNLNLIKKLLRKKDRPEAIIATVEKFTTDIYMACEELKLIIGKDVKVVCFSNLSSASILNPSLTTVTQPAFEMGRASAKILFKALKKEKNDLSGESLVIPSILIKRNSSAKGYL